MGPIGCTETTVVVKRTLEGVCLLDDAVSSGEAIWCMSVVEA
jgi:hypothetical protein